MAAANSAAETLKERSRLVVVPVGGYVDMDSVNRWATFPPEQNVIPVPGGPIERGEVSEERDHLMANATVGFVDGEIAHA